MFLLKKFVHLQITSEMFLARLKEVRESDETKWGKLFNLIDPEPEIRNLSLLCRVSVTGMPYSPASLRMVTHLVRKIVKRKCGTKI